MERWLYRDVERKWYLVMNFRTSGGDRGATVHLVSNESQTDPRAEREAENALCLPFMAYFFLP
jgi:hypothetical protein